MKVSIKSAEEIALMREAGKILASVHQNLAKEIRPGMSTADIDRLGEDMIRSYGCIPSFKNYLGYPASVCVSVNEEVVHGIPEKHRMIEEGDIVSLDAGVIYRGYHSDAARTVAVGNISTQAQLLIERTRESKDVFWAENGWTVVTADGALSAHYENTILITEGEPEILSLTEEEKEAFGMAKA